MCGILGWVGDSGPGFRQNFEAALDRLEHRGPDGRGVYSGDGVLLGHRRLAILDLRASANQPMIDRETGCVVTFNGEIFNYIELRNTLRKKGRLFTTESDTEVLLQGFLEWGESIVNRLNGMWAFAIWLPRSRQLFVSRDRFGEKPFYFYLGDNEFALASEPKGILGIVPKLQRVNSQAVYEFLEYGRLYTNGLSFYDGIHVLLPGHSGVYEADKNKFQSWSYWDYPKQRNDEGLTDLEAIDQFTSLFDDSVRLRMRSDVPIGFTLSGGLDSTSVLASAMEADDAEKSCFTSVYGGEQRGESEWAGLAASVYGMKPIEVSATNSKWLETMPLIAWHMDGPGYSPAVYPLWALIREAKSRGIPVLLEGQGADEAFGGYPHISALVLLDQVRACLLKLGGCGDLLNSWHKLEATFTRRWLLLWLGRELFPIAGTVNRRLASAGNTLRPEIMNKVTSSPDHNNKGLSFDRVSERLEYSHSTSVLPGLLHYGDAMSMAHGVESRNPFVDHRLVEWIFGVGTSFKVRQGESKWLIREFLRRRNQTAIGDRSDKLGFPTPVDRWLAANNGELAKRILLSNSAMLSEFCSPHKVRNILERHLLGKAGAGFHLYKLISLEFWLRSCMSTAAIRPS